LLALTEVVQADPGDACTTSCQRFETPYQGFDRQDRFIRLSDILPLVHLLSRAPLTSVKRPEPNDTMWGSTRLSYAPPRVAASRLPIAFLPPEPCRWSSGAFDLRRLLGPGRPP